MSMSYEKARSNYLPKGKINFLFIAESPPKKESKRFFYFENINDKDWLFVETMKVLYEDDFGSVKELRERKREFLRKFQEKGFYLIDAVDFSISGEKKSYKKRKNRDNLDKLVNKTRRLKGFSKSTKIILISSSIWEVCKERLIKQMI